MKPTLRQAARRCLGVRARAAFPEPRCLGGGSSSSGCLRRSFSLAAAEQVTLSQERLDQLLEAEITTTALKEARDISLQDLLDWSQNPSKLAKELNEELPVRIAHRIAMLESLTHWKPTTDEIDAVRQMYITSFKELKMVDVNEHDAFAACLTRIRKRHLSTNRLVSSFKQYANDEDLGEAQINEWLDRFFTLRISTNLLISQFFEMMEQSSQQADATKPFNPYQSFINSQCDPYKVATHAADVIQQLSEQWYGCAPKIHVTDSGSVPFTFVPRYLFYILSELLKNAVRATVERRSSLEDEMTPIHVIVCARAGVTSIRISDEGGGIAVNELSHVWSYLYTTAEPADVPLTRESVDAPTDLHHTSLTSLEAPPHEHSVLLKSPLAGLGCGLPLSRLYAQYLGGKVVLHTLPRFGTDVFVYLPSLGKSSEALSEI